jgi:hypothetical protein
VIPLLGIYTKKCNSGYNRDTQPMFTATVFTMAKLWQLPRCPDEWILKIWYIYTMKKNAIKKNEIILVKVNGWN